MAQRPTFPRSHILIFGPSSVQSLLPVTLTSQAETLLQNHQIKDVIELADKYRKKVQGKFVVDPDEVPVSTLSLFAANNAPEGRRTRIRLSENWLAMYARDTLRRRRLLPLPRGA
jgi:hypothetical protein